MWLSKGHGGKKGGGNGLVAVAIDKDKGSQSALKWATENLLTRGQTVVLIHVIHKSSSSGNSGDGNDEKLTKELFLTFHCFCTRKDIHCLDITLEDTDVVKALTEYVSYAAIENLVLGATSRHGFIRFKTSNLPSSVSKGSPDFCTVYVISKGKISSVRNASRAAPYISPLLKQIQDHDNRSVSSSDSNSRYGSFRAERISIKPRITLQTLHDDPVKSPFARGGRRLQDKWSVDYLDSDTDISFVSSGRPSTDRTSSFIFESMDSAPNSRLSTSTTESFGSTRLGHRLTDNNYRHDFSTTSEDDGRTSCSSSSQGIDDVEAEMRRLKLELKQTMDMYSTACKEALTAQRKTKEMNHRKLEEERRLEEARIAEESAMAMAERERAKCRAAVEAAEAAQRIAELEAQRRLNVEMKALKESEEMKKSLGTQPRHDIRYRWYSIEEIEEATDFFTQSRKIGEGGYGPVYKCYLDHTPVAVKVLRPDAAQGRSQFQQEVEVLSCIRHPNMVLLLGACPEYGCLVYEYMAKGSLDDRLFRRGNSPVISWQLRFRIAAEIATGLLFLHQTKPEPLVHRDLKPSNILLDHNYVSKISDVGLARLVPTMAENVTQCRMTSTAGTFCYIDPEYQQTGMLGVKSDVYSLGIMFLQLITAKPPMGLAHYVEMAIENGTFADMLDPAVPDWPVEEALCFAKMALQCAELRRKDRPDLCKEILPELCRLRELGDENMTHFFVGGSAGPSPNHSQVSVTQDMMSESGSTTSSLSGTQ